MTDKNEMTDGPVMTGPAMTQRAMDGALRIPNVSGRHLVSSLVSTKGGR
ncbi:hypothetical protein V1224_03715 [Lachnospiraceae bacterium JLR.KK008]